MKSPAFARRSPSTRTPAGGGASHAATVHASPFGPRVSHDPLTRAAERKDTDTATNPKASRRSMARSPWPGAGGQAGRDHGRAAT